MMENERVNIYTLKNLLRADITLYEDKKKEINNNSYLLDIYKEIISLLKNVDAHEILENSSSISLLFSLVYDENMANAISKEIISIAYAISKYSQSYDCEKELLIEQEKLKKVVRKVLDEYEIIINKNEICISEINGLSEKSIYRKGNFVSLK